MATPEDREREALSARLDDQRIEDQRRMDVERAVERERLDNRLNDHDRQLRELAIHVGKIADGAERFEDAVRDDVQRINASVMEVKNDVKTLKAVWEALAAKSVSTRTFLLGAGGLGLAVVTLFLTSGHAG